MSIQEIKIKPDIDIAKELLIHGESCPEAVDFKAEFQKLKAELPKNPFFDKDENRQAYNDFLKEMYCEEAENSLETLNESTKVFFEKSDENWEAIARTWDSKFTSIVADVKKTNGQLIEEILAEKMERYRINPEKVSEITFTEDNKNKVREEFQKTFETAKTALVEGMARLARQDLAPGSTMEPTFDLGELRQFLPEINMLYGAWSKENIAFSERLFVNLGKLSPEEKNGLSEKTIQEKESVKKRKELITFYLELRSGLEGNLDDKSIVNKSIALGWVIREIHDLGENEQQKWLEEFIKTSGPESAEAKIEEVIANKAIDLAMARLFFHSHPEYQEKYKNLYTKMESGQMRKDLERTPMQIAMEKEKAKEAENTDDLGKINAAEALTRSPLRSIVGAYGMFAGVMGIVLNILARKDLLMQGDILGVLKNPALGICGGYAILGTEMVTGESGMGSGLISDWFGKLRGEELDSEVSNEKIRNFSYYCRTYLDTRQYLAANFEDVKAQIEAKQEERKGVQEQISEGVLNSEEQGKDFIDFVKKDPAFLKDITGLDGFTREETIAKIVDMYVFTRFAKDKPENKEDFDQLVAKILNPSEHLTT